MTTSTMKAIVTTGPGGTDRLEFRNDVPVPRIGPQEVRVRLFTSALNNTDVAFRENWYSTDDDESEKVAIAWPRIQGAGGVGVIDRVGAEVSASRIGETVLVDPFIRRRGVALRRSMLMLMGGAQRHGCFANYVAVPDENAVAVPANSSLSFEELACLPTAYQTAEEMQIRAQIESGHNVLVTGASGGVGSANVLLAKLRGARVVAVAGKDKHEAVRELGADVVVDRDAYLRANHYKDFADFDAVLDVTGGETLQSHLKLLRPGGNYVTAGAIAGWDARFDLRTLIYSDLRIIGQDVPRHEALTNLIDYCLTGRLRPKTAAVFDLEELRAAQDLFVKKQFVGKIIIKIADSSAT